MQVKLRVKPKEAVASPSASSDPVSLDLLPGPGAEASREASEAPGPEEAMPQLDPSLMQGSLLSMLQGLDDDEAVEEQAPEPEPQLPRGAADLPPPATELSRDQTPELQQASQSDREQLPGRDRDPGEHEPGQKTAADMGGLPPAYPDDRAPGAESPDHEQHSGPDEEQMPQLDRGEALQSGGDTAMGPPEGSAPVSWSEDGDQDSGGEVIGAPAQHGIEEHVEHAEPARELARLLAGGSPQGESAASMEE